MTLVENLDSVVIRRVRKVVRMEGKEPEGDVWVVRMGGMIQHLRILDDMKGAKRKIKNPIAISTPLICDRSTTQDNILIFSFSQYARHARVHNTRIFGGDGEHVYISTFL